jgi:hypothetical protein
VLSPAMSGPAVPASPTSKAPTAKRVAYTIGSAISIATAEAHALTDVIVRSARGPGSRWTPAAGPPAAWPRVAGRVRRSQWLTLMRTCVPMTSDGSAYARFRRALNTGNPTLVIAAARELPQVGLHDALRSASCCETGIRSNTRELPCAGSAGSHSRHEASRSTHSDWRPTRLTRCPTAPPKRWSRCSGSVSPTE